MQYLRDRYKKEIGYEYPEDFDKVEFYVEWLERIVDEKESNRRTQNISGKGNCFVHTTCEVIAVAHNKKEIQDMFEDEKSYIMFDAYSRCISIDGNNDNNTTIPICVPKSQILKW